MSDHPIDILSLSSLRFCEAAQALGISRNTAIDVYRRFFRDGVLDVSWAATPIQPIVRTHREHGTTKFVQRHDNGRQGLETESVILPYVSTAGRPRNTLCVSSQIGCAMGCTFCETAQMGFMKNLSVSHIVGQWFAARHLAIWRSGDLAIENDEPGVQDTVQSIDNIVFMGMGEPMENLDNVIGAIEVLTDQNGAGIAPSRISVSTVGRVDGILRLAALARQPGFHKLRLAVSVNAPNDEIRSRIMPINRSTPMATLMEAMLQWPTNSGGGRQRVLIEYVLIPGVNDAEQHAAQLCAYLRPLKCTVNVIPYNPRRDSPWPAPSEESVREFVKQIHEHGQFVKRRQTLGRSVMAACGQLGNPTIRGRKLVK
jgi:23S rRNA (adenine2503-C2)-methyltransferase